MKTTQKPKKGKEEGDVQGNITIEGARIAFKNFEGKAGQYNLKGQRNFCVLLDPDQAVELKAIGWNVKYLKPREEEDTPQAFLQVKVSYDKIPPKIIIVTDRSQKILDEATVHILDWAEIKDIDLIIKPYNWVTATGKGVKAYVKTMYVTIVEDEFAKKYEKVPDSAASVTLEEEDD